MQLGMSALCQQQTFAARYQHVSAAGQTYAHFRFILQLRRTAGVSGVGEIETARAPACIGNGVAMRQFEVTPPAQDIVHPTCAKCGAPMWLTRIEPDGPHSQQRTFECQACQNEAIEIVKF